MFIWSKLGQNLSEMTFARIKKVIWDQLRVLAKKLASRLATQRKSLPKFNLRQLASTSDYLLVRLAKA